MKSVKYGDIDFTARFRIVVEESGEPFESWADMLGFTKVRRKRFMGGYGKLNAFEVLVVDHQCEGMFLDPTELKLVVGAAKNAIEQRKRHLYSDPYIGIPEEVKELL